MRCALVIPSWVPEEIFSARTAGSQINYWQPLGTLYVASILIRAGHEVSLLNGAFLTPREIMDGLRLFRPDFVGIYSTAFGWEKAKKTAAEIKKLDGEIYIAVGGPYPTAVKGRCLNEEAGNVDAVVAGEAEHTVVELIGRLNAGGGLEGIPGLVFRQGGRVVDNGPAPLIEDLDSLPYPARELLGDKDGCLPPPATYRRKPVAVMITSRGCSRRCIYCFQIDRERKAGVRYRSIGNVVGEIEHCLAQGYREIKFIDDTLAADYGRAMDLAGEIKRKKLDFTWFASACVNQVDGPLLKAFREAGCWAILLGAESGVQKNLNTIKKGIRVEDTVKAVRAAKDAGLKVLTPFLFGIPGETYDEGLQTIRFACELDPDIANFHAITPFPGTKLYDEIEKYGTVSGNLEDYTYQGIAFVPYTMSRDQIAELRRLAFVRFYSRPSFLLKRFLSIRTPSDLRASYYGLRSLFWVLLAKGIFRRGR
jgi:radical SAM superfamily enzyme YgiQ (UPF0313 family)